MTVIDLGGLVAIDVHVHVERDAQVTPNGGGAGTILRGLCPTTFWKEICGSS
jgi:hypothetical protein